MEEDTLRSTGVFLIPRSPWGVFFEGLGIIALGVVLVAWPDVTINVVRYAFGIFAIGFGAIQILNTVSEKREGKWWNIPLAVVSIAAGIVALAWANATFTAVTFIVGAWFIVSGLILAAAGLKLPEDISARWVVAMAGVVSLGFGIFLIVRSIYSSAEEVVSWMVVLIGIFAIVEGLLVTLYSFLLRKQIKGTEAA